MGKAVIALGGNLGNRAENLRHARERLGALGSLVASSGLYETPPIGPPQPHYLNAAVLLKTQLEPRALLHSLLSIENEMGRRRNVKWGSRSIDLDLIAFDHMVLDEPQLKLPHPRAHQRPFVLLPLLDLCPELVLHSGKSVRELVESLEAEQIDEIREVADSSWRKG